MTSVATFQPLFPEDRVLDGSIERAATLIDKARRLLKADDTPLAAALVPQLRSMNSYYTNKIEGQHTTPGKIEAALRRDYSPDADEYRKQRMAIAHIAAESELESEWREFSVQALFDPGRVRDIHARFFSAMPLELLVTPDGDPIIPGALRDKDVTVGRHEAPEVAMIEPLMAEWGARYRLIRPREFQLIAIACSHHRLAWIHPFIDGNGRVCRLHSHLALHAAGLTQGLWSPLRGFARSHETYYSRLAEADMTRRNDLDGRGNLSQEALIRFVDYFLDCCLDQVDFMLKMVDFDGVSMRLKDLLLYLEAHPWQIGSEKSIIKPEKTATLLEFIALRRALPRADFVRMLGESENTGRRIIRSLLDFGILKSATHRDDLAFALPLKSLRFVFPRLWPEVDIE
ncbi:Fic family protein [Burkholderia gladioli]|uniref:Fic family protein n=1 Tax=Burkholderia gladioli TaxID=28095 RepID=UPI00164094C9|nr:Fic family protein [Burkholderia gladioli]